jgi:hypothetical protein
VPAACIGVVAYIYHLNTRVDRQKKSIERHSHSHILSLTDELMNSRHELLLGRLALLLQA